VTISEANQNEVEMKNMAKQRERYMTVLGGYKLDMRDHGRLVRDQIDLNKTGDYGCDPVGDGTFKMVPSGDIVDLAERNRRLETRNR
jgi:hypothetical protein